MVIYSNNQFGFKDYCPDEKPVAGAFDESDGDPKGEAPLEGVVEEDVDEDCDAKGLVPDAAPGFAEVAPGVDGLLASPGL